MLAGRAVWGAAQVVLLGISGGAFTWKMFLAGAFFNAIPGIVIQLILIPALMVALNRTGLVRFREAQPVPQARVKSSTPRSNVTALMWSLPTSFTKLTFAPLGKAGEKRSFLPSFMKSRTGRR